MASQGLENIYRRAEVIAAELRERIVVGKLAPGDRMPTRDALTAHYQVSKVTVQRALEMLTNDGFVIAEGRRGTFVRPDCPHLTRYALLFPLGADRQTSNQLWKAMTLEARAIKGEGSVDCYYGFEGRVGFLQYQALLNDVRADRLAGLIFASAPYRLEGTPLLDEPGIPRTAVMSKPAYPNVPAVSHDGDGFLTKALDYFAAQGRRRLAAIFSPRAPAIAETLRHLAAERGIQVPAHWVQSCSLEHSAWAHNLVRLLFAHADDRPDCLLVADDNLLETASLELRLLGLRVPDDLALVGECNFPWPTPCHLPVKRIGYSISDCLRVCLHNIDLQRQGQMPASITRLPALYDHEYQGAIRAPQSLETVAHA